MSPEHLLKKSFGSLPCSLLVRLSGSYIVLAANGPHLPMFPPSHPLSLPHFIFSPPPNTHTNCCVFLAAPCPFSKCYRYHFGCQELIILRQLFWWKTVREVGGLSVCLCLSEVILLSYCRAEVMDHSSLRMSHLEIMATDKLFPLLMPVI